MTIKTIAVAHKKAGMTTGEFNKYWLEQHSPLAARLFPGLRKYVQNHFVIEPGRKYEGDGIVEMWYDDLSAMKKAMAFVHSGEGKVIAEDADRFCDMSIGGGFWIVEEHVIKDELSRK